VRKKILLNYWIIGSVALAGFVIEAVTWMALGIAAIILFIVLYTPWYSIPVSRYEALYEDAIIKNMIKHISKGLSIDKNSHLSLNELHNGLIITGNPQYFGGSYLIHGEVDSIPVRISEISSRSKKISSSGEEKITQYFNGLAGISSVELPVESPLLICTNHQLEEQLAKSGVQIPNRREDAEGLFMYCSDDEAYAHFISGALIGRLHEYVAETGNKIVYSITGHGIALAILQEGGHRYLRPSVFRSTFAKNDAAIYYRDLLFMTQTLSATAENLIAKSA
jgi:hypothetical protein